MIGLHTFLYLIEKFKTNKLRIGLFKFFSVVMRECSKNTILSVPWIVIYPFLENRIESSGFDTTTGGATCI